MRTTRLKSRFKDFNCPTKRIFPPNVKPKTILSFLTSPSYPFEGNRFGQYYALIVNFSFMVISKKKKKIYGHLLYRVP